MKNKKAFTMLELVFVIVVSGILAATMIPRFDRDNLQEAADQVISHIRYTQHLAMVDDKFDANKTNWYKERWQLLFGKSSSGTKNSGGYYAYTIFSDKPTYSGDPDLKEIAVNPLDNTKLLSGGFSGTLDWKDANATKTLNIGSKFGIISVLTFGCGGAKRIAFDYLGRPIRGNLRTSSKVYQKGRLLTSQCRIALCKDASCDNNITIAIEPETGYAHIL